MSSELRQGDPNMSQYLNQDTDSYPWDFPPLGNLYQTPAEPYQSAFADELSGNGLPHIYMSSAPATNKYMPHGIFNIPTFSVEIDEREIVLLPYSDGLIMDVGRKSIARTLNVDDKESFSAVTPEIPIDFTQWESAQIQPETVPPVNVLDNMRPVSAESSPSEDI